MAAIAGLTLGGAAIAQDRQASRSERGVITLFEFDGYSGKRYEIDTLSRNVDIIYPINSIAVHPGETWQVCENPAFREPCMNVTKDENNLGGITIRSARPVKN